MKSISKPRLLSYLVVLCSIIHAIVGFFLPIPAWKMFWAVPKYSYELKDNSGKEINIRDYVQLRAYTVTNPNNVVAIGQWYANEYPSKAPLTGYIKLYKKDGVKTVPIKLVHNKK